MAAMLRRSHLGRFSQLVARTSTPLLHGGFPSATRDDALQSRPQLPIITLSSYRSLSSEAGNTALTTAVDNTVRIGEVVDSGLGGMTPVGLVQQLVEWTSAMSGLPWVGGIVLTTVLMRTLMLPVVFGSMRNNTILMNIQPEMQLHSNRMRECQTRNDHEGASRAAANLQALFSEHKVHPLKGLLPLLFQAPVFISFFMALRGMASLPLESMKHGGALWFPDLTVADPYYILPITASLTMLATIEIGSEGVKQQNTKMKNIFRIMAVAMLPVTISFPSAIFVYWCTANVFSLSQVALLKIPGLKPALGIPPMIQHPAMPEQKSFKEEFMSGFKAVVDKQKPAADQVNIAPPAAREVTENVTATRKPSAKKGKGKRSRRSR
eukprot:TRINITY_DN4502_c0_g1_i1.p1 TRINITY_DN4502_c0_g1~~TRINITY_DN4502_c0_g1_i1.p1  ORF type:complete len:380 (+),score=79.86 TRINITY_DN4502_c0_g1_i1:101-1240(+)